MADAQQLVALAPSADEAVAVRAADENRRRLRQIWRLKGMLIGCAIVLFVLFLAVTAPLIAPHNPYVGRTIDRLLAPSWMDASDARFLLGTDALGRDVLSRLIFGARVSITVAVLAVIGASTIGV